MSFKMSQIMAMVKLVTEVEERRKGGLLGELLTVERYDGLVTQVLSSGISHDEVPEESSIEGTEFTLIEYFKRNSTAE